MISLHADFDEVFETLPANGWLTKNEAKLLWDSANSTEGDILEVGIYYGRSTTLLTAFGRTVHCVDPFDNFDSDDPSGDFIYSRFVDNMTQRNITNFELHRMKIENFIPRSVGFAYLDGDHTYQGTINQINAARACGASDVCLHDYSDEGDGRFIKQAVGDTELVVQDMSGRLARCFFIKTLDCRRVL